MIVFKFEAIRSLSNSVLNFCTGFFIFTWLLLTDGVPIDNGIAGTPQVNCGQDYLEVAFQTRNPFEGRIFSKGAADVQSCRQLGNRNSNVTFRLNVGQAECGVRRLRSANPQGISVDTTVVISFHPIFITKVDQAYRVSCFYMEADKTVTSELDVSMITTAAITNSMAMPVCKYEILQGSIDGPPIRFAKVGDQVFHKWSCDAQQPNMFCMRVHSCTVDSGQGEKIPVVDPLGCGVDQVILQHPTYFSDLMAGQEAHVFKFADKSSIFFNCQIELKLKDDSPCETPVCPPFPNRFKVSKRDLYNLSADDFQPVTVHFNNSRNRNSLFYYNQQQSLKVRQSDGEKIDFDLPPQKLTIFDEDDQKEYEALLASPDSRDSINQNSSSANHDSSSFLFASIGSKGVCLSTLGFALFLPLLIIFTCSVAAALTVSLRKYFKLRRNKMPGFIRPRF